MDESGKDGAECGRKVVSGRRVAGVIRSLVKAKDLQLECARVLHETLVVPVITYGSETMLGKRKRYLELGLYRLTTGGWIKSKCTDQGIVQSDDRGRQKY